MGLSYHDEQSMVESLRFASNPMIEDADQERRDDIVVQQLRSPGDIEN